MTGAGWTRTGPAAGPVPDAGELEELVAVRCRLDLRVEGKDDELDLCRWRSRAIVYVLAVVEQIRSPLMRDLPRSACLVLRVCPCVVRRDTPYAEDSVKRDLCVP